MNRINERLTFLQKTHQLGLMTHMVLGYPDVETNLANALAMQEAGADFLELQIPFSDPVADGPTMMGANQAALDGGMTVSLAMQTLYQLKHQLDIPYLVMTYYNIVHSYGVERFVEDCRKCGVSGLIVPDMPPDEEPREGLFAATRAHDLINLPFLSPGTSQARITKLTQGAEGFAYCFATRGVTGARAELDPALADYLARLRAHTNLPLAVGFGLKTPEHMRAIQPHADIAIVGSALIDHLRDIPAAEHPQRVAEFVRRLKSA